MAATSSPKPGMSPVLIVIILIALFGMIGLNAKISQFTPKSDEEEAAEAQKAAAANATPTPTPTPVNTLRGPQELAGFSPGGDLGNTKANDAITVGFSWTPAVQGNPVLAYSSIDQLVHAFPEARIEVKDADLDPSVPLGVSFGGMVRAEPDADGTLLLSPLQMRELGYAWMYEQKQRAQEIAGPPPPDEKSTSAPKPKTS